MLTSLYRRTLKTELARKNIGIVEGRSSEWLYARGGCASDSATRHRVTRSPLRDSQGPHRRSRRIERWHGGRPPRRAPGRGDERENENDAAARHNKAPLKRSGRRTDRRFLSISPPR
ncbi:hypothetical protein AAFF_G00391500 [Aldrovandia affinis]|uniref:Uncharacterized protein n=1 Tax=Aldrovandia affinis TaxID=143900 RepID=A0AAD7WKW5_9TELE|nr:hypothetical protein AAFF_G00391500 [Aldrovandia affinis]